MTKTTRRALLLVALLLAVNAPCRAQEATKLSVVASFSILADLVRNVGGDHVEVTSLVGPNGDVHAYSPTPADSRKLAAARLVFVNGLGLEGWIARLIDASKTRATVVTLGEGVAQTRSSADPHVWQDVSLARALVERIGEALASADPANADAYAANRRAYAQRLTELDTEIFAAVDALPRERRRLLSTHDAFHYFAARYGLEFIAPQGVSTEAEPSARDVARIIDAVRARHVHAVFLENIGDPRLMRRISQETGAVLGGELYSDALSEAGGPAANYIDMMRHNVKELIEALSVKAGGR